MSFGQYPFFVGFCLFSVFLVCWRVVSPQQHAHTTQRDLGRTGSRRKSERETERAPMQALVELVAWRRRSTVHVCNSFKESFLTTGNFATLQGVVVEAREGLWMIVSMFPM